MPRFYIEADLTVGTTVDSVSSVYYVHIVTVPFNGVVNLKRI